MEAVNVDVGVLNGSDWSDGERPGMIGRIEVHGPIVAKGSHSVDFAPVGRAVRYAQKRIAQIFIAVPATTTSGLKIKTVAKKRGVSPPRAAIAKGSAAANRIAFASDVSAINANRQIMQQPVIHSGQETTIGNPITVGVVVLVMNGHIIAATHGKGPPAIVRSRGWRWRHNVLADHVLAFRGRIDFHDRSAIRISIGANLVHPALQVSALDSGARETHFVHRGELFRRNQIKDVWKGRDASIAEDP